MAIPAILVFLPLLLLLLVPLLPLFLRKGNEKEKAALKLPPGPAKLPIIGNLHQLGRFSHRSLCQLSQHHGPLMYLKLGRASVIVASSASMAKEILQMHDLECCGRPSLASWMKLSYGGLDVAFSTYGEQWRELRKICVTKLLNTKKILSLRPIREEEMEKMISTISSHATHVVAPINLSQLLLSVLNNIVLRAVVGKSYTDGAKYSSFRILRIISEAQFLLGSFFMADYIPWMGWLDVLTGKQARLEKNYQELDDFYEQVINEHLEHKMQGHDRDEDLLDALLDIHIKDETDLNKDHIKAVLMDIFVAGTDTSAATVEWAMAELMRNPEAKRKAQDEVREIIGMKGKVQETDLHQLPYLKSVVKETMRLHPPGPLLIQRETIKHCKISDYNIPPKTRITVNVWAIGKEESSWEMPEKFYPERFMNSSIDMNGHDFKLIPFGSGRRICPGMNFGILSVEFALANLLYSFDWELPGGMLKNDINMDEGNGITLHKKSPLFLVATKVNKTEDKSNIVLSG